jgi:RNA polymerase sigma-70 factor (ECF subfamily)
MAGMNAPDDRAPQVEHFREYLRLLARVHVADNLRTKLDPSDIVQQTMLEAHRKRGQFRGTTEAEMAGWLRQMLAFAIADAVRALGRAKRDIARERSLDEAIDQSSKRIDAWLAAEQSSPSQRASRHEEAVRLANALAQLPDAQREAVTLRYCNGRSLAEISQQLGRTPTAVSGLIKRGTKQLRTLLADYA